MERLLNIMEAAEFLNVSEMTVRRWTNQGVLNCYRVGRRRARRFRPQDLLAYLEGRSAGSVPATVALGVKGIAVPDGAHITHLSSGQNEALEFAAAYILEGLKGGETVCVVAAEDKAVRIMNALKESETRLEKYYATGKMHMSQGSDSPERHTTYLLALAAQCGGRFRVYGDMAWTRDKGWPAEELARFEKTISSAPPARRCLFLCHYALESYRGTEIMMALETHSHNLYRGALKENASQPRRQTA